MVRVISDSLTLYHYTLKDLLQNNFLKYKQIGKNSEKMVK